MFDSTQDGIDHINIYSKGKTKLGKFLSNFTFAPFEIEDIVFYSVEAYWYWLLTDPEHPRRDSLRIFFGADTKKLGRSIRSENWEEKKDESFKQKILEAIAIKIKQSSFLQEFIDSTLPFAHYYVFDGKVILPGSDEWLIQGIETLRVRWKADQTLVSQSC